MILQKDKDGPVNNKVISLKKYTSPESIQHVMYRRQEIESVYKCPACGDLQVIGGVVVHTKAAEDHDALQS
jgi:hypothetical protein